MGVQVHSILRELRDRFEAVYGDRFVRLVLYGSHARGDADPDSDIDVLAVLRGPVSASEEAERTGDFVAELSLRHSKVISCLFMDEERFLHRQGPLLRNIRKEGVPV